MDKLVTDLNGVPLAWWPMFLASASEEMHADEDSFTASLRNLAQVLAGGLGDEEQSLP
jgi:hypothetical protein